MTAQGVDAGIAEIGQRPLRLDGCRSADDSVTAMKLLACVTSCDRPLLHRNAVESHLRLVAERGSRLAGPENDTSELWRA